MAFEGLTERLQGALSKLRRKGKVTEADVNQAMREIRLALLEADVNFKVLRTSLKSLRKRQSERKCWRVSHQHNKSLRLLMKN